MSTPGPEDARAVLSAGGIGRSGAAARGVLALAAISAGAALPAAGADLSWDGDCGEPAPQRFHCSCAEAGAGDCNGGGTSNWDNDGVPGPADNATIPAGSGRIRIDNDTTVLSINAGSGLDLDFYNLVLVGIGSSIQELALTGQGTLWVNGAASLIGPSTISGVVHGPGTVESNGSVDLSFTTLRDLVVFRNLGNADVATGDLDFGLGGGALENHGSLTISSDRDVGGPQGLFTNAGSLVYTGPGTLAFFDPQYVQTTGDLHVQGGNLYLQSTLIDLQGGNVTVDEGAALIIASPIGGPVDRRFNGIEGIDGGGLLDVAVDMTVSDQVAIGLGSGLPGAGSGGCRIQSNLTLDADLINVYLSRMRFRFATLVGSGRFWNFGEAYVIDVGNAEFQVDVQNDGRFSLVNGPGIVLSEGAVFRNNSEFKFRGGNITQGSGAQSWFLNDGRVIVSPDNPTTVSTINTVFESFDLATVEVFRGTLEFQGTVQNLQAGVLEDGTWTVYDEGKLVFPGPITALDAASVLIGGGGQVPQLETLSTVTNGRLSLSGGANLSLSGPLSAFEDGDVIVEEGCVLQTNDPFSLGNQQFTIEPRLSTRSLGKSRTLSPKGAAAPATVIAPTIDNGFGRVMPGDHGTLGELHLEGVYVQGPGGSLEIDVAAAGADRVSIVGDAQLDGALVLNRLGPVSPGSPFVVLTTTNGTITGSFDEVLAPDVYSVSYTATGVTVVFEENLADIFGDGFESGTTSSWSSAVL